MSGPSIESKRAELLDEIHQAVLKRFPVLQLLEFSDQGQSDAAQLPHFIGLLATILETADRPCCVVLPDAKDVAIGVSTLVAVTRLQNEFPEILRAHASASFEAGQDNVLVHPSGLVYRYDGFFTPMFFKLGVIDRKDSRSLPVQEIARLEKTTRKRPKGYLNSDLGQASRSILSSLLGIKITLNRNFLRTYVVVLGARKTFVESLNRWTVQIGRNEERNELKTRRALQDEIPFGKVIEGGKVCFLDGYVAAGEPLVAVASRVEDLAAYCAGAEKFTKAVLVEDIDQLTRDLRAYDSITESQRTIILASDSDRDSVRVLKERGCEVWRLSPDEMLLGIGPEKQQIPLRNIVNKASYVRDLVISELSCGEENLDRAVVELKHVSDAVSSSDNGTIRELLYSLFRIVTFCAEYLGQDGERFASAADKLLGLAKQHLQNANVWLSPQVNDRIKCALDSMQVAVVNLAQCGVTPKGKLLRESLTKAGDDEIAVVVARAETDCKEVQEWLNGSGVKTNIYLIGELPDRRNFDQVLVVSWPRSERFDRLVHQYLTNDLRLLAYRFEEQWLNQYRQHYKRSFLSGISGVRKRQLIGLASSGVETVEGEMDQRESENAVKFDVREEQFLVRRKAVSISESDSDEQEESVDAYYVDFAGLTFAYLTDGHDLPVLNSYISEDQVNPGKVPLRSVGELKAGDYVMFRESGDSDIIRFLAEDEIGKDQYQRLRSTAGRWRTSLRKLGKDPKLVWDRLRKVGFSRHLQTVRGWLVDESRICPKEIDDVRKIAEAAQDNELVALLPDVERAKDELMSLHIGAGFRLTELLLKELPKKISLLGHGETELDLGVGRVWIVHIHDIERSSSAQRRSHVNRLLWDEGRI